MNDILNKRIDDFLLLDKEIDNKHIEYFKLKDEIEKLTFKLNDIAFFLNSNTNKYNSLGDSLSAIFELKKEFSPHKDILSQNQYVINYYNKQSIGIRNMGMQSIINGSNDKMY